MPKRRPRSRPPHIPPPAAWVARSEVDLVAMVPVVLGFHPTASVVVLTFGGRRAFHARTDLPLLEHDREEVARMLARACRTNGADLAAVLIYTDDHARARCQGEHAVIELLAEEVDVVDVLRVHDGRWFEVLQGDEVGTAYDLSSHEFTARSVFEGVAVHEDREALRATLECRDPEERLRVARAAAWRSTLVGARPNPYDLADEARWLRERVRHAITTGEPVDTADAARMLCAVERGGVRDAAWVDLRRADAAAHTTLWRDLVTRSPRDLLPGACGMLALAAYLHGDGALAWCAIDRAVEVDPEHTLVRLVADLLGAAVPPSAWPTPSAEDLALLHLTRDGSRAS